MEALVIKDNQLALLSRMVEVKKEGRLNSKNYKNIYFEMYGGNKDSVAENQVIEKVWNCRISKNDAEIVTRFENINERLKNE